MIKTSNSHLVSALQAHLQETQQQVVRLEQVFASLDETVKRKAVAPRGGPRGQRGVKGGKGARGRDASPDYILSVVESQFRELREHMNVQLVRTGQLQVELDRYHRDVGEMRTQFSQVNALLKQCVTSGAEPGAPRAVLSAGADSPTCRPRARDHRHQTLICRLACA